MAATWSYILIICAHVNIEGARCFRRGRRVAIWCVRVCVCEKGEFLSFGTFTPKWNHFITVSRHNKLPEQKQETCGKCRQSLQWEQIRLRAYMCMHRCFVSPSLHTVHTHTLTGEEYYSLWQVYHAPPCPTGPCYSELCALCPCLPLEEPGQLSVHG